MSETKERPILFSAPMVRAIIEDRKGQTRRVVKHPEHYGCPTGDCPHTYQSECDEAMRALSPYGKPGDRLWVREAFRGWCQVNGPHEPTRYGVPFYVPDQHNCTRLEYRATFDGEDRDRWRPATNMPRWASRILLEVTEVRVERLQDVSEEDAKAEGADRGIAPEDANDFDEGDGYFPPSSHVQGFCNLWASINGKGSWDANPWVWVVEFKRVEAGTR